MADIWIANTTKQNVRFQYRLPEGERNLELIIPPGGQSRAHNPNNDLTTKDIESIVRQLTMGFGAVRAADIDRTRAFVGLAYATDKPIRSEQIENGIAHNTDVLTEQGAETRKKAAAAVHETLAQAGGDPRDLAQTTVEHIEEVKPGETPKVNERTEVHRPGEAPAPARGRKNKR